MHRTRRNGLMLVAATTRLRWRPTGAFIAYRSIAVLAWWRPVASSQRFCARRILANVFAPHRRWWEKLFIYAQHLHCLRLANNPSNPIPNVIATCLGFSLHDPPALAANRR